MRIAVSLVDSVSDLELLHSPSHLVLLVPQSTQGGLLSRLEDTVSPHYDDVGLLIVYWGEDTELPLGERAPAVLRACVAIQRACVILHKEQGGLILASGLRTKSKSNVLCRSRFLIL